MSEKLKPCPICEVNNWQYQAYFSGTTVYQCGECGTIVDESAINTRPIEDELRKRIAELGGFGTWQKVRRTWRVSRREHTLEGHKR